MTLKHLQALATVVFGVHASPVMAQDAAIDAMQEYVMFPEDENGIILPSFSVDIRDAGQFEEGTIPGGIA